MADFFSGLAEGLQSSQSMKASRQNLAIQQQELEIKKQQASLQESQNSREQKKFDLELGAMESKKKLDDGLNQAFSDGGFEGAMDYLKHTDMSTYMSAQKTKAEMDKSISDASSSQFTAEKDRTDMIKNGHMLLGRFGASILAVPENERPQVYQQILPVLKSVDKTMPDSYSKEAENRLLISMGVSMPDSQLYGAEKKAARAQTKIGQLYADIQNLKDRGADPNDPALKALQTQLVNEEKNSTEAQLDAAKNSKGEDDLSKRYIDMNAKFIEVRDQYAVISTYSSKNATPAGEMKLINSYQRMIDPGAVVREGEYATVKNAGSWSNKMRANYNAAKDGKLLTDEMRNDILNQAAQIYTSKKQFMDLTKSEFTRIAVERGLNPKNVVIDLEVPKTQQDPQRLQAIMQANPGYSEADALAAMEWEQKQKTGAPQPGNPLTPQMDSQDSQVAQQMGQQPAGEGNPPWLANRGM